VTEATNPPASEPEAAPAQEKRAIFDDDEDEGEYVPPVPQSNETGGETANMEMPAE